MGLGGGLVKSIVKSDDDKPAVSGHRALDRERREVQTRLLTVAKKQATFGRAMSGQRAQAAR